MLPKNSEIEHASLRNRRPKQHGDNADHRFCNPSQDEAVHEQAEVDGFEAAKKCGRFAAVTNLHKLHVGNNLGPAPIPRKKEHCQHAAYAESPPDPVPGDSLLRYDAANKQRCVGSERGRHH